MSRYKHTDLEDDVSFMGSVQFNEGISSTATHIRYHTVERVTGTGTDKRLMTSSGVSGAFIMEKIPTLNYLCKMCHFLIG
ncbi:hypothetical protein RUM43_006734 [Polyplax serrata]|uniref:Uncharacterized protein n=1 Tax=Polyplax serrata TaxID=468196 RepID=A0AAN8PW58_POLSC